MVRKNALVVDDSKSARAVLSGMLEKYDIEVDTAESAEQAIEYLNHHRPDAIFMDHQMPGMDGLQAVRAIKSNPLTATIPIMMYTSQEGELYVGQARALGAMGVLPKQVRAVDVSKVLHELRLLPERRDMEEAALSPVELDGDAVVEAVSTGAKVAEPDWAHRLESTVREQAADHRRFIMASLDSVAERIVADLRPAISAFPDPFAPPAPPAPPAAAGTPAWPWVLSLLGVAVLAGGCAVLWAMTREELAKSRTELAALTAANADLQRSGQELSATLKDLTAALAASTASLSAATPAGGAATRIEAVPYGEIPFDRNRLEVLRDFLGRLEAQNFRGSVKITSAAGAFCLTGNPVDGYVPAPASLAASKCDLFGNPFDESLTAQQRQSLDFANLLASVRQRSAGAINVVLENAGSTRPATAYPERSDSLTAGEWNRAAASNNRVEFSADPAPSASASASAAPSTAP